MRAFALVPALVAAACPGRTERPAIAPSVRAWDKPGVSLSIYHNLAVVRDVRELELTEGSQSIAWDGLATSIQPHTLQVRSLTDPDGTRIAEQVVEAPVLSGETLLARSVGGPIAIRTTSGEVRGTLRAYDAMQIVVDPGDGRMRVVPRGEALESFSLGGGASVSPTSTARWIVGARRPGRHVVEVAYDTFGLHWEADYMVILESDGAARAELSGWATIWNDSGVTYRDAWIQLSARNPMAQTMAQQADQLVSVLRSGEAPATAGAPVPPDDATPLAGFGPATLPDRRSTRLSLVAPRAGVPSHRRLVYDAIGAGGIWNGADINRSPEYGATDRAVVDEYVELSNDVASGLGRPLPAGRARVFSRATDGALRWLGESDVAAVKPGDRMRLRLGPATGVRGERKQLEYAIEDDRKRIIEEIEITIVNDEETPREVLVLERMARGDTWRISWHSTPVEKEDTRTIRFALTVPAKGTERVRYRVIYSWR